MKKILLILIFGFLVTNPSHALIHKDIPKTVISHDEICKHGEELAQDYIQKMQRTIKSAWRISKTAIREQGYSSATVFSFLIDKEGKVLFPEIVYNDASSEITIACQKAIDSTSQLDPLPDYISSPGAAIFNFKCLAIPFYKIRSFKKNSAFRNNLKKYYEKLISNGYPEVYTTLASNHIKGDFAEKDYAKAFEYFKKAEAANVKQPVIFTHLGIMHFEGKGADLDYKKAVEYFTLGSESDEPFAKVNLARMLYHGIGIEKDLDKSLALYKEAKDLGLEKLDKEIKIIEEEVSKI